MENKVTLKTINGKHIVKADGKEIAFTYMWDALEFIYSVHSRRSRNSL